MTIDQLVQKSPLLISRLTTFQSKKRLGIFACFCGTRFVTTIDHVKQRHTKSCGCLTKLVNKKRYFKHGESGDKSPEYRTWDAMIQRCTNSNTGGWKYYGARGIKVCTRWRESYKLFLKDMGRRPTLQHSIDRINNDGNYDSKNCRWATKSQQNRNKRNSL